MSVTPREVREGAIPNREQCGRMLEAEIDDALRRHYRNGLFYTLNDYDMEGPATFDSYRRMQGLIETYRTAGWSVDCYLGNRGMALQFFAPDAEPEPDETTLEPA